MRQLLAVFACASAAAFLCAACRPQSTGEPPPPPASTTSAVASSRAQITGTLTALAADVAVTDPIAPPFTITVPDRGNGGAEFDHVTVNGKTSQVNWNAGQPLPVRGSGQGLNLNAAAVRVDSKGIVWSLDGAVRDLLPGAYTLASSVAVGSGGLGASVDSVNLTAGNDSSVSTRGGAMLTVPAGPLRIEGQHGTLELSGKLVVTTPTGTKSVTKATFGPGTYVVTLTPAAGGYDVVATLDGKLVT
jgi:hypothetical protein